MQTQTHFAYCLYFFVFTSCLEWFWGETTLRDVYTVNRIPITITNNRISYEWLYDKTPNYNIFKVFGSSCFVFLQSHEWSKLKPYSRLYYFLGYVIVHKDIVVEILFLNVFVSLAMLHFRNIKVSFLCLSFIGIKTTHISSQIYLLSCSFKFHPLIITMKLLHVLLILLM